jgi:hypothetical protein
MPKGIKEWAIWTTVWTAAQAGLTLAFKWAYKLAENAMIGWGDDQIAGWLGITSPDAATVFSWAMPFVLAAVTLFVFYKLMHRGSARQESPPDQAGHGVQKQSNAKHHPNSGDINIIARDRNIFGNIGHRIGGRDSEDN